MLKFIKEDKKHYYYWGLTAFIVIAASVLFYLLLSNLGDLWAALGSIVSVLAPVLVGFVISFLFSPLLNFYEKAFMRKLSRKACKTELGQKRFCRGFSTALTMLSLLLIVGGLMWLVIPKTIESLTKLIEQDFPNYLKVIREWLAGFLGADSALGKTVLESLNSFGSILGNWLQSLEQFSDVVEAVSTGIASVVRIVYVFFVGVVISAYMMYNKEKFAAQFKKISYAVFKEKRAESLLKNIRDVEGMFSRFISGKLIDSLIIGICCYIGMTILRMPYKELISVVIGVTNIIPFIGPLLGAVPSGLLLLLNDPLDCLIFLIFIIVLQQLDGNILGPRILGDATGLPGFWVLFSIIVGGGLFGFFGMVCGVPVFAIIYDRVKSMTNRRLAKKGLPTNTEVYYARGPSDEPESAEKPEPAEEPEQEDDKE